MDVSMLNADLISVQVQQAMEVYPIVVSTYTPEISILVLMSFLLKLSPLS